ncbi:MAG: hypothetical protein H7Z16_11430 [Pyrinomonadaceae bacterium]|nr:hypothetical protein [Pyrinomonadaceae bacterium]
MALSLQSSTNQFSSKRGIDKAFSTGRWLTVCKTLVLVVAVVVSSMSEVVGQRSPTLSLTLPVLTTPAAHRFQNPPAQLDAQAIQTLLREVEAKHKEANAKLEYYSYILKRTEHELNDKGEGKRYRVHEYRVFPRREGLQIAATLSENGKELSPVKLAKEKARANKEWQKHRKKSEARGQKSEVTKSDEGKAFPWFDTLDFTAMPPERIEDREVVILSFRPRAKRSDDTPQKNVDKFVASLKGQVWIDPVEKIILKFQAELTRDFSAGGLSGWLSKAKPGTAFTIENMRLADCRWVVKRVDSYAIGMARGPLWLPHTYRFRVVDEMSDYRPFDPNATDLFAK